MSELRSDLTVRLMHQGQLVGVLVVEVQLSVKEEKRVSWPCYHVLAWRRHRVPVEVLVFTPSQAVARWASTPVSLGTTLEYQPTIVGPDGVPRIDDPAVASQVPELTLISTMAHGNRRHNEPILKACLAALDALDASDALLYYDVLFARLNAAAREVLHTMFNKHGYEFQSEFAINHIKQLEQRLAEGQLISLRRTQLKQAQIKFGALSEDHRERIEQAEMPQLEVWLEHILSAETADALLQ
ncbi:MAG: hypothetical protein ACE366_26290 [Bradymonadia bacterium]